jgi:hypothetical protein
VEHTWAFRGNVVGVKYKDGTPVTADEVHRFILSALGQWSSAANQEGVRIRFTECPTYDSAEIKVLFVPYNGTLGSIASTFVFISDSGHAFPPRLETTILHEMGHLFLGSGHHGDGVMSQLIGSGHSSTLQTSLSPIERRWALEVYNPRVRFTVANVFGDGSTGGCVLVDSVEWVIPQQPGFLRFDSVRASTFPHTVSAINRQRAGGCQQQFDCWNGPISATCVSLQIDTINNARYEARFKNIYGVSVWNDFAGDTVGGCMRIGRTVVQVPLHQMEVLQSTSVMLEALDQPHDFLLFAFQEWSDGVKEAGRSVFPDRHIALVARYVPIGALAPPDVRAAAGVGEPVRVAWKEHPKPSVVKYLVTRSTKSGKGKAAEVVALLDRGTTAWTDPRYVVTQMLTHDVVTYGVQSLYAPTGKFSDPEYMEVFGRLEEDVVTSVPETRNAARQGEFSFALYPQPTAGRSQISYQLPVESFVMVEVFDATGRRIKSYPKERKRAGLYTITWNGLGNDGGSLSVGIYFCRLTAESVEGRGVAYRETKRVLILR